MQIAVVGCGILFFPASLAIPDNKVRIIVLAFSIGNSVNSITCSCCIVVALVMHHFCLHLSILQAKYRFV